MLEAKAETMKGITAIGTTSVFNYFHDVIPFISTIGILAGSILAIHGVYELLKGYIVEYRNKHKDKDKHNETDD